MRPDQRKSFQQNQRVSMNLDSRQEQKITDKSEKSETIIFIKAIHKAYFDSFMKEGQICMNTDKWFREYASLDSNVGDKSEGAEIVYNKNLTVFGAEVGSKNFKRYGMAEYLTVHKTAPIANIYSLYSIPMDENGNINHCIPYRFINEFKNHRFAVILNAPEFINRITDSINKIGQTQHFRVKYYPIDSLLRRPNLFEKNENYSYQNEYRIILRSDNPKQFIFNIGSLDDICEEIDLQNLPYLTKDDSGHTLYLTTDKE